MDAMEELVQLAERAQQSAEAAKQATAGGVGSPIEVRMAQAFVDTSASLSAISDTQKHISEYQEQLAGRLDSLALGLNEHTEAVADVRRALDDAQLTMVKAADSVASARMDRLDELLYEVEKQARKTMSALGEVDSSKAKEYAAAVDDSVKKLTRATALSAGSIFALSLGGGCLAAIGAWWLVSVVPWLQAFMSEYGFFAIAGLLLVAFLAYCIVTRKR